MISVFNAEELKRLLEDFYCITKIRITVFDAAFREVISYPEERPEFCQWIRSCEEGCRACKKCDADACAQASGERKTHIYQCHAGLTEAITPLYAGKVLIGYLLFGHVFAYDNEDAGWEVIRSCCEDYPVDIEALKASVSGMPRISHDFIRSAAQILRMTASFLVLERMATLQEESPAAKLDRYLTENFAQHITAELLCRKLGVGRSKLYAISQEAYGCGIQQQQRKLRMEKARELLEDQPQMSIMDVAIACGYDDYNYFISVFSRFHGMPPKQFRQAGRVHSSETEL